MLAKLTGHPSTLGPHKQCPPEANRFSRLWRLSNLQPPISSVQSPVFSLQSPVSSLQSPDCPLPAARCPPSLAWTTLASSTPAKMSATNVTRNASFSVFFLVFLLHVQQIHLLPASSSPQLQRRNGPKEQSHGRARECLPISAISSKDFSSRAVNNRPSSSTLRPSRLLTIANLVPCARSVATM